MKGWKCVYEASGAPEETGAPRGGGWRAKEGAGGLKGSPGDRAKRALIRAEKSSVGKDESCASLGSGAKLGKERKGMSASCPNPGPRYAPGGGKGLDDSWGPY